MKKSLLSIICVFATLISIAQIPNFSFENWTTVGSYEVPNQWGTLNNATKTFSIYTATKATPGNPGNFYLKITSKTIGTAVVPGIAVSGVIDSIGMKAKSGFAYMQRPANFTGKWQHMIYGSSQGSIMVTLTRWDVGMNMRMPVASGSVTLSGMAMSWANFSIPLSYVDGNNPDTCIIVMKASGSAPTNNDYLWVDNLLFTGTVLGINNVDAPLISNLNIFPNPTNEILKVSLNIKKANNISIELIDFTGKLVLSKSAGILSGESVQTINISNLSKGIYFVKVIGEESTETRKIVIE